MNAEFEAWLREQITEQGQDLREIKTKVTAAVTDVDDHDQRLRSLERSRSEAAGFMKGVYWLWGLMIVLAGLFGIHLAVGGK